jgi:hypothetical protein
MIRRSWLRTFAAAGVAAKLVAAPLAYQTRAVSGKMGDE